MKKIKLQSVMGRLDGIQRDIEKLRQLGALPFTTFESETNFVLAQYYLRRALEGVFHIGSHVLSRLPGNHSTEYKEIAVHLGEAGIIDKSFSIGPLKKMAGYRNRLTHFYADVTPKEIYSILQKNLDDFDIFLKVIKEIVQNPEKFGLQIEE